MDNSSKTIETQDERLKYKMTKIKHKIIVMSGKVGVGKTTIVQIAKEMKVPFLGEIPIDPRIMRSGDSGKNIMIDYNADSVDSMKNIVTAIENIVKN